MSTRSTTADTTASLQVPARSWYLGLGAALALWAIAYSQLVPASEWLVSLLPVARDSHLGEAPGFFLYDTPKVMLLLTLVVFAMGVVRSHFSPAKPPRGWGSTFRSTR